MQCRMTASFLAMAGKISMAARAEVTAAIRERYVASGKAAKGAFPRVVVVQVLEAQGVHAIPRLPPAGRA